MLKRRTFLFEKYLNDKLFYKGGFYMRILLVVLIIFIILIATGIIYIRQSQDRVTITIDTNKVQQKTEEVIETGKEIGSKALKQTGRVIEKVGEKLSGEKTEPKNQNEVPAPGQGEAKSESREEAKPRR
jgi:cell division protein FtsL